MDDWVVDGGVRFNKLAGSNSRLVIANSAGTLSVVGEGVYGQILMQGNGGAPIWSSVSVPSHTHSISDVTGLQTALDGKAATSHTQAISTITGLQTALDGKAATSHTHAISDVTGLQTALDGKAASSHTHTKSQITDWAHAHAISDVTGLQTALDGKAATSHTQAISTITGLQTALDGKAATSHSHAIADVTGLQTALDGKASTGHNHSGVYAPATHYHAGSDITSGTVGTSYLPSNSSSSAGIVSSGSGQANKVWKTDASGNPGWRDDATAEGGSGITSIVVPNEFTISISNGTATIGWRQDLGSNKPKTTYLGVSAGSGNTPSFREIAADDLPA